MTPVRITLTAPQDGLPDREVVFAEPAECLIGRGPDCAIRVPNDPANGNVSRRHCALEVDPPHVRVRDLGSRNGTFVNGRKIGQRPPGPAAESSGTWVSGACPLQDGDVLGVAGTTFRVRIAVGGEAVPPVGSL
jgi:pSer/pThr/pTyr-binding forkhead associated (FHA) protein